MFFSYILIKRRCHDFSLKTTDFLDNGSSESRENIIFNILCTADKISYVTFVLWLSKWHFWYLLYMHVKTCENLISAISFYVIFDTLDTLENCPKVIFLIFPALVKLAIPQKLSKYRFWHFKNSCR